jgi:hypothetical protein
MTGFRNVVESRHAVPSITKRAARRTRRRLASWIVALALMTFPFASTPARANPLVCVTLYYQYLNSSKQYVLFLNNWCPLSGGSWMTGSGPHCTLNPAIVDVCWTIDLYFPI